LVPIKLPGIQVYVCAPVAVRLAELPTQIEGTDEERLTVGVGFTITATVRVDKHPKVLAPVAV
jgi:hypothetical protein